MTPPPGSDVGYLQAQFFTGRAQAAKTAVISWLQQLDHGAFIALLFEK